MMVNANTEDTPEKRVAEYRAALEEAFRVANSSTADLILRAHEDFGKVDPLFQSKAAEVWSDIQNRLSKVLLTEALSMASGGDTAANGLEGLSQRMYAKVLDVHRRIGDETVEKGVYLVRGDKDFLDYRD